ncbi:23S rRNA maturation-related 3'-5' exoribonuclease YhaM [Pedobacter sp. W3I1]|uniref:hypothetical protein n=1 Tax=Pedobacter sp. W3I1 TaxID=3042291 RepID=UPI0027818539|nr:hypothetical protein [Pedobacter sp. W3I1]MDQ0638387.1 23S rRNA maturation-related 3'-5' exoribonuclease YhaM [Pedobacter sp. W3I1]
MNSGQDLWQEITAAIPRLKKNNSESLKQYNMEQFRIEVAIGDHGKFYDIRALGNARYEISENGEIIGTIILDGRNHTHCESQGCELDLPALHAIREGIQAHEGLSQAE